MIKWKRLWQSVKLAKTNHQQQNQTNCWNLLQQLVPRTIFCCFAIVCDLVDDVKLDNAHKSKSLKIIQECQNQEE
jgi:hypothetical protein